MDTLIIRITTDNQVICEKFPQEENNSDKYKVTDLIKAGCIFYERFVPYKLLELIGNMDSNHKISMIAEDPDVAFEYYSLNRGATWLNAGICIFGNVWIVGEKSTTDGYVFSGISENVIGHLKRELERVVLAVQIQQVERLLKMLR